MIFIFPLAFSTKGSPEYKSAISNILQKMQQTVKVPQAEQLPSIDRFEQHQQQHLLPQQQQEQFEQRPLHNVERLHSEYPSTVQTEDLHRSKPRRLPFFEGMSTGMEF